MLLSCTQQHWLCIPIHPWQPLLAHDSVAQPAAGAMRNCKTNARSGTPPCTLARLMGLSTTPHCAAAQAAATVQNPCIQHTSLLHTCTTNAPNTTTHCAPAGLHAPSRNLPRSCRTQRARRNCALLCWQRLLPQRWINLNPATHARGPMPSARQ